MKTGCLQKRPHTLPRLPYLHGMTRKQLTWTYALLLFLMVWGLDLVATIKYSRPLRLIDVFGVFSLSQLAYGLGTLLATRFVFRRFFNSGRYGAWVLALLLLVPAFVLFRYGIEERLYPAVFGYRNYGANTAFSFYFLDNVYYALVYIVLGAFVFFADEATGARKQQQQLAEKSREAELAFLRSQIQPHFLFNSLNNIYALSYAGSPRAPEAILKLSELMRYMLYEKKEALPLRTEWEYVQHFIALQQLRYAGGVDVHAEETGPIDAWMLPPYLLIAFVENAFKHGDFSSGKPLGIRLNAGEHELYFYVSNAIGRQQKDAAGGIGLENVRRRLELLYPGRHRLATEVQDGHFRVSLQLTKAPA
ncbi:MAG: histidine kinase [Chitinophagaceae bacterium]|nr:MAG: histidine kinase [Chitinophagaceae bacterium]